MTNIDALTANASAIRVDARRQVFLLLLIGFAAFLRLYSISSYPLAGDEYGSIAEAKAVGLNWNSIIYSSLMHFWIRLGMSELWLRLPSAIFGTATVAILFKIGEKLGGWRTGVVAGLLAATSPFNIYHSQEVRFYSLFICASAGFMLATISYVDSRRAMRDRVSVLVAGVVLVFSHFLGVLALYAQSAATAVVIKFRWPRWKILLVALGLPILLFALPLMPVVQHELWRIHRTYSNAAGSTVPVMTPVSLASFAKIGFAGFVFMFGYHVYPLKLAIVIAGAALNCFLLLKGILGNWREDSWKVMTLLYALMLVGVYVVLDSVGGRLAGGVSPRHVAFAWPLFLLLTAIGLASFKRPVIYILVASVLTINALSLWSGWKKEWTYGTGTDYRSAAQFASRWLGKDTAILHDGRSSDPISYYFRFDGPTISSWSYEQGQSTSALAHYGRVVFITDDYQLERRRGFNRLLKDLSGRFTWLTGRVDYPLFEYVLQRKIDKESSGFSVTPQSGQVQQPLSIYGLEFQDLQLPITIDFQNKPLSIVGATELPGLDGNGSCDIPLANPVVVSRILVLTNVIADKPHGASEQIAELEVKTTSGQSFTYPLRLGTETALWDYDCALQSQCTTVYRWHKRMAILGQNAYPGAWRDFWARIHGVAIHLPRKETVTSLTMRYKASSGHLYLWGLSLSPE